MVISFLLSILPSLPSLPISNACCCTCCAQHFLCLYPNRTTQHDPFQIHQIPSAHLLNSLNIEAKLETSGHPLADNDHKLKSWNANTLSPRFGSTPFMNVI